MKKGRNSKWLSISMGIVLLASAALGGCGGGSTDSSTAAETTTAAATTQATETAAPETEGTTAAAGESQVAGQTQAGETASDLAAQVRGNTNPSPELIEQVNSTLDDSYLAFPYGLVNDYSAYDGRFDGVTLDIWMPNWYCASEIYPDLSEHPSFKQVSQLTGIKLNFITPTIGEESSEFNMMLASGDLPDIILSTGLYYPGGPAGAVRDGLAVDLASYEDKLPNYIGYIKNGEDSESVNRDTVTDDGLRPAVYLIWPNQLGSNNGPNFLKKAMEDTGWTEVPVTVDEYHSYLTDCKNAGYDVPFLFNSASGFTGNDAVASAYGVYDNLFLDDEGKVAYGPTQDGMEDYLQTMSQWYQEGLIAKDFVSNDSAYYDSVVTTNETGLVINAPESMAILLQDDVDNVVVTAPFPVLNQGDQPTYPMHSSYLPEARLVENVFNMVVTTQCENIDAALAFMDFGFTAKGIEIYGDGTYGDVHLIDENGMPYYHDNGLMKTDEDVLYHGAKYTWSKFRLQCFPGIFSDIDSGPGYSPEGKEARYVYSFDNNTKQVGLPGSLTLTAEETASIADITTNLNTLRDEYYCKIITGQLPLSAAEEYREKVKEAGVDTYVATYQAAYDRYMAR